MKRFALIFVVAGFIGLGMLFFSPNPGWKDVLISYIYTFSFWYGNFYFSDFLYKKFPDLEDTLKRLVYSISFILIFSLIVCLIGDGLIFQYEKGIKAFLGTYIFAIFITILITAIHGSITYFQLHRESIEERGALKRAQMENELKVLSSQVNPHFLFNSLNTLMSLIPEDSELAVKFTQKLSDVYRYVLQSRNKDLTSLENELDFTENYIFLMKIRFGENLTVTRNIEPDILHKMIPVLSMQMLIENATKHNTISGSRTLEIIITANENWLEISNNRNPKILDSDGTGTGLENIRRRYAFFSDEAVQVINNQDQFSVKVPLLEVNHYESADY